MFEFQVCRYSPSQRENIQVKRQSKLKLIRQHWENRNRKMKFYEYTRKEYGRGVCKLMKEISNVNKRLANFKNRQNFLLRCRQTDIIPKCAIINLNHIQISRNAKKFDRWHNKVEKELLNQMITETICTIKELKSRHQHINNELERKVHDEDFKNFKSTQKLRSEKIFQSVRGRNIKKFDVLKEKKLEKFKEMVKDNWIVNHSDTILPDEVNIILSLGPNFGFNFEYKQLPIVKTIANIEAAIFNNPAENQIRAELTNIITNFLNGYKVTSESDKMLLQFFYKTKKFVKENNQIVIVKSDKSNRTVILNRSEYEEKMEEMVSDKKTYIELVEDPSIKYEKQVNDTFDRWYEDGKMTFEENRDMKAHNTVAPGIYGLVKEKEGRPLRPVVSTIQSPTYKLSKMLASILTKAIGKSRYHVKDSWEFAEFIRKQTIPNGHKMVSLDAKSLFTNVAKSLSMAAIRKRWWTIKPHTKLTQKQFIEAVSLVFDFSYFRYGDRFYKQFFGVAMGNPISGFLADIVVEDLELEIIPKLPFELPYYVRFVDDIKTAIPDDGEEIILEMFNSYHKRLQFTMEIEEDKKLNFLDMTVIRQENGTLNTIWYQKTISSGRYLNYRGINPIGHKRNVAIALIDRAVTFTNPVDRPAKLDKVRKLLSENGYPKDFVEENIKNRVHRFYNNDKSKREKKDGQRFVSAPYIPGLSERIKKTLKKHDITLSTKTINKVNNVFTRTKYKIATKNKSKVVYRAKCLNCPARYIGNTKQKVGNRMYRHDLDYRNKKMDGSSMLTQHAIANNHKFDTDNVEIMEQVDNYWARIRAEAIHILKEPNAVNHRKDCNNIHASYVNVFQMHPNTK